MATAESIPYAAEDLVWQSLGQRPCKLTAQDLAQLFHPEHSKELRMALAERLGMKTAEGLQPCLDLIDRHGPRPELLMALGMTHQPGASDVLFRYLEDPTVDRLALLRSMACWGRKVPLSVIQEALEHHSGAMRLAGLELLHFHAPLLKAHHLLRLCEALLGDIRPPVAIAAIRLLQRRHEPLVTQRLARVLQERPPEPVWEVALQALGCIGTETSIVLLWEHWLSCRGTPQAMEVLHQLGAQFRHRDLLRQHVETLLQENRITAMEVQPLLLSLQGPQP